MILAIETATNICSVSFQRNKGEIHEKRTERKGSHSELLFIFVRELMEEHSFVMSDLDKVLVSTGPGSYTGLRIAASAVKGMLFGLNTEIFAGNTLAGFAFGVLGLNKDGHKRTLATGRKKNRDSEDEKITVHAVINARRKHLYYQQFEEDEGLKAVSESQILELAEIEQRLAPGDFIIGTGIERLHEESLKGLQISDTPSITSKALIELFESPSGEQFFVKTTAEELESNYLTSSQVNNTKFS